MRKDRFCSNKRRIRVFLFLIFRRVARIGEIRPKIALISVYNAIALPVSLMLLIGVVYMGIGINMAERRARS